MAKKKGLAVAKGNKTVVERPTVPAIPIILAVAVGEVALSVTIDAEPPPSYVRPYIRGLVSGLRQKTKKIGKDYTIEYREYPVGDLKKALAVNAQVIFCMSARVMDVVVQFYTPRPRAPVPPIVGVVSDPEKYLPPHTTLRICGFSAKRWQTILDCYVAFRTTVPSLQKIFVLHDPHHGPSKSALETLSGDSDISEIDVGDYTHNIPALLSQAWNNEGQPANAGILVLPVDRCFGAADDINKWGMANNKKVPIFWPVTDFVRSTTSSVAPSALGGYGVSQEHCGEVMGAQVAHILDGKFPSPAFVDAATYNPGTTSNTDITWAASKAAADAIKTTLVNPPPRGLIIL